MAKIQTTLLLTFTLTVATETVCAQPSAAEAWAAIQTGRCETAEAILEPLKQKQSPEAFKLLGDMYAFGLCKSQDYAKALPLYISAAKRGLAIAQLSLARTYENGNGTPVDAKLALYWYKQAAEQGNAEAQTNLAVLYLTGRWVERNDFKGAELTEVAALQGFAPAQSNLGKIYREGIGRKQDLGKAEHWYRLAAEQGDAAGLVNLGGMNEMGISVPQNRGLAYVLYRLADKRGSEKAHANLRRFEISLSTHQLQEANKIVETWKPSTPLPKTFPYQ